MKRRDFLTSNAVLAGATISAASQLTQRTAVAQDGDAQDMPAVRSGNLSWGGVSSPWIRDHAGEALQSRSGWRPWKGIPSDQYGAVTDLGLKISLVSSHGFAKGPLDPENHAEVEKKLRSGIDLAAAVWCPQCDHFHGHAEDGYYRCCSTEKLSGLLETCHSLRRGERMLGSC